MYCVRFRWPAIVFSVVLNFGCLLFPGAHALAAPNYASGVALGTVNSTDIVEASGLMASRQNPGILWVHNDHGFSGSAFALSTNGALAMKCIVQNMTFGDFEDIAIGPGPSVHYQYIYIGDIGDNDLNRSQIRVFRFPEPAVYPYQAARPTVQGLPNAQELVLRYPDGPFDCEGMMIDPVTGDLLLATKRESNSRVYRATQAALAGPAPVTLQFVRNIPFDDVSGADISSDGSLIAVRREDDASVWRRAPGQSISSALGGQEVEIPVIGEPTEPNGEGLGFHPTGLGYYTISEEANPVIYYFRRTDSGLPVQPRVLIRPGEVWKFQDTATDEGTAWRLPGFNDASWKSGAGQLGYGQGDEFTQVFPGEDLDFKTITTYFRKTFVVAAPGPPATLALRLCFNDGVAVYLDGTELLRRNLNPGALYDEPATASNSDWQNVWYSMALNPALLPPGSHTFAVELHRFESFRPDLSFDLQLVEAKVEDPPRFTGPPKLTQGNWTIPIAGLAGSEAVIETSQEFKFWGVAGSVILTNGQAVYTEEADGTKEKFFRIQ